MDKQEVESISIAIKALKYQIHLSIIFLNILALK